MPSDKVKELTRLGREFLKYNDFGVTEPSDQQQKLPQPPLVKEKMTDQQIDLPIDFENLDINSDMLQVFNQRETKLQDELLLIEL